MPGQPFGRGGKPIIHLPAILKVRAKLKEKEHDYDQALADLELVLKQKPRDVQTWVEKS